MKIYVESVSKSFKEVEALVDISCTFSSGEVIGLVGPNGAGKTTLLRIIAGLLDSDLGRVLLSSGEGISPGMVTYIPETPDLFPLLTLWEHHRFVAMAYGKKDWEKEAHSLLERFEILHKRDSFVGELSRGMKQKVMLSISLMAHHPILLFDEPFLGLDPYSVRELREMIKDLKKDHRILLISSHNLESIYHVSDRVLILDRGHVLLDKKMEEVIEELKEKEYLTLEDLFMEVTRDGTKGSPLFRDDLSS